MRSGDGSSGGSPGPAVSTHVLDTARGLPAAGIEVRLERVGRGGGAPGTGADGTGRADTGTASARELARARTGADGRVAGLGPDRLEPGSYRLVFGTGAYLAAGPAEAGGVGQRPAFFPEVVVVFTVTGEAAHYHLPLLLSPFGYSTYRGS